MKLLQRVLSSLGARLCAAALPLAFAGCCAQPAWSQGTFVLVPVQQPISWVQVPQTPVHLYVTPTPQPAFVPPPVRVVQAPQLGVELLQNGSFEAPGLAGGGWGVFRTIPGWESTEGPGIEVQNHATVEAAEGNQHVELDSHAPSDMAQTVESTPGAVYRLSLAYSPRPGVGPEDNTIEVYFGEQLVDTLRSDGTGLSGARWTRHSWTVVASSTHTRVRLRDAGIPNSLGGYLDALSLVRVQ